MRILTLNLFEMILFRIYSCNYVFAPVRNTALHNQSLTNNLCRRQHRCSCNMNSIIHLKTLHMHYVHYMMIVLFLTRKSSQNLTIA